MNWSSSSTCSTTSKGDHDVERLIVEFQVEYVLELETFRPACSSGKS